MELLQNEKKGTYLHHVNHNSMNYLPGEDSTSIILELNGHKLDVFAFRKELLIWGSLHFRSFPWRLTNDPYHLLIAEVMLHRTQASQVQPVYVQFIDKYPDLTTLAKATLDELQLTLFSLGLHWRVDMIHAMSRDLQERFNGQIPQKRADLISLPGVSEYIASAVLCFSWNRPEAVIDTNTVRIAGRLFGLDIKESSRRNRVFKDLLKKMIYPSEARRFNYALLDLASLVCTKKLPKCCDCPVCIFCIYGTEAIIRQKLNVVGREPNG